MPEVRKLSLFVCCFLLELVAVLAVEHKRSPKPNKKDLNRKFTMEVDEKGNPKIAEVKD